MQSEPSGLCCLPCPPPQGKRRRARAESSSWTAAAARGISLLPGRREESHGNCPRATQSRAPHGQATLPTEVFTVESTALAVLPVQGKMDRASRQRCWDGRDDFFKCLDSNNIIDPQKDEEKARAACGAQKVNFEANCVATWVDYFSKKRVLEIQRENMIKEAQRRGANILSVDDVRRESSREDGCGAE